MTTELLAPETLSMDILKSIFDAAYMDTEVNANGHLHVSEGGAGCFMLLADTKDRIQLLSVFGFQPGSSMTRRLECVNKINTDYIVVKATAGAHNMLIFQFDICISGGITPKNLVLTTKRFMSIPSQVIQAVCSDIVS